MLWPAAAAPTSAAARVTSALSALPFTFRVVGTAPHLGRRVGGSPAALAFQAVRSAAVRVADVVPWCGRRGPSAPPRRCPPGQNPWPGAARRAPSRPPQLRPLRQLRVDDVGVPVEVLNVVKILCAGLFQPVIGCFSSPFASTLISQLIGVYAARAGVGTAQQRLMLVVPQGQVHRQVTGTTRSSRAAASESICRAVRARRTVSRKSRPVQRQSESLLAAQAPASPPAAPW